MKINFNFIVIFLLFIIGLFLVVVWLPDKVIIAGGDIGIPVLSPLKVLREQSYAWWDTHATGIISPTTYTALPFYLVLTILEKFGLTADINQKILFLAIIFGGAVSIYFLALNLSFKKWTASLAALFYIFNLASLSVWQRGIHNAMLMLLFAPLTLLILVWGIKQKKYSSIILINIVSLLLSYTDGALGYIFSLWLLWTLYVLVILIDQWKDKATRNFLFTYYLIFFVSWFGTNLWWIIHLLSSSNYILGSFSESELKARGSDVLVGLKAYHEPSFILRGVSRFYNYVVKDWGNIYLTPGFVLLSWIPPLVIFYTTLVKENYKSAYWKFLILLISVVLIVSKGVNAPLGLLNKIPYDLFQFLAPLRNPYEKVGILLTIPYALLFAQGVSQINILLKNKKFRNLNLVVFLAVILCLTVLVWPLWLGKIFVSEYRKYDVAIPSYYSQANDWLKEKVKMDDTRILHLPLAWGESIDYNWDYTGIEPSQYFFNGSSLGYQIGIPSVDSRIRDLIINVHNQDTTNIQKALASLNVGWVIIHNETLYKSRILEPPEEINKWLDTKPYFLEHVIDFGPLSILRVKDQYRAGHFYSESKLVNITKPKTLSAIGIWDDINTLNDGFLTEIQKNQQDQLSKYINKNVVFPKSKIKYSPLGSINAEAALKEVATVKQLSDSLLYPLIILKEKVLSFLNQDDSVINCFNLSGKRLLEAALLARQNKVDKTNETLKRYESQLNECMQVSDETMMAYLNNSAVRDVILGQLVRERAILKSEFNTASTSTEGDKAKNILNEYLANLGLSPKFEPTQPEGGKQIFIFSYSAVKEGSYSLELEKPRSELIKTPPKIIQIDDKVVNFTPIDVENNSIKYPSYQFSEGFHEIHIQTDEGDNLLKDSLEAKKIQPDLGFTVETDPSTHETFFSGEASTRSVSLAFDLPKVDIEQSYDVSFETYFDQGAPPVFSMVHKTDPLDILGNVKPAVKLDLQFNSYPVLWSLVTYNYTPPLNAKSAQVVFTLTPWNDCLATHSVSECSSLGGQYKFDRPTDAKFRRVKVTKLFDADLVLKEENNTGTQKIGTVDIKWDKVDPTLYNLHLSNQKPPYIIVFSETFHPLWQLTDSSGKKIAVSHFSINGFANGWFVDKKLDDNIKVRFVLQDSFTEGIILTAFSWIIFSGIIVFLDFRRRIK